MRVKKVVTDDVKDVETHVLNTQTSEILHVPVDHGWAWFVMFGAFMNICCIMMFIRSSAILFIQFLEKYQASATMTTLAFGLCSAMFAISNILGPTILLKRFEVRTLAITGAVINFLGIFVIAFAPNIILLDLLMACLGFSHGLISVPQMALLGQYFKKRLSFANAFVSMGLSIPTIAGPPLVQFLLDTYGLQGSIIILAGINMNCIPASMLFRPVSQYAQTSTDIEDKKQEQNEDNELEVGVCMEDSELKQECDESVCEQKDLKAGEESVSLIRNTFHTRPPIFRSVSESPHKNACMAICVNTDTSPAAFAKSNNSIHMSERRESIVSEFIDIISVSSSIRYLSDPHIFADASACKELFPQANEHATMEDSSLKSMMADSNTPHAKDITVKSFSTELASGNNTTCLSKIRKSMSESIYTHPLAILLLLASGCGVHTQSSIAYMPAAGKENGLTDYEIPYLITIVGVCDLVSKLFIGAFADLGYVKRIHIACACEIFLGTLLQFVAFFQGFPLMIVLQVGIGLTIGVMHVMVAVIVVDILGVKHLGHIVAGYYLVNGFVITIDHLVIGSLKDFTGSFLKTYNYIGALILLSAFLLLLEPFVAKMKPAPES